MPNLFLSYAHSDDIAFVRDLYGKLTGAGFGVWWDQEDMPSRGLTFLQEIRDAIQRSDRLIVVIGHSAVASDYVRAEWQHALAEGRIVTPILRLGDRDLLPPELKPLHCPDFRAEQDPETAFEELLRILHEPVPSPGGMFGEIAAQPNHFRPRPDLFTRINSAVFEDLLHPGPPLETRRAVVLHGMGGIGKSVLAAAFARSISTRHVFENGVYWLDAGEDAEPKDLLRGLGELIDDSPHLYDNESVATTRLRSLLSGKRILVILDNVERVAQLEAFTKILDTNTRLLVTCRNRGLATATGAAEVRIGFLSASDALQHLADWTGLGVDELPDEAAELARRCGYHPFALALSGAMVHRENEWDDLIQALGQDEIKFLEWEERFPDYPHPSVVKCIEAGLNSLANDRPDYAERYRELVVFLAETVPERAIAPFWRHRGGVQDRHVRKILLALERRALLRLEGTAPQRRIRLHPLQRSHLRAEVPDQPALQAALIESYRQQSGGEWWNGPQDGYFHEHIVEHLITAGYMGEVEALLEKEGPEGGNAWYAAHEKNATPGGFYRDVRRAWREVEQANGRAVSAGRSASRVGFEIRCALYEASMRSLAELLSPEGFRAKAEEKGWRAALGMARIVSNPRDRFHAILGVLLSVPAGERAEPLSVAADAAERLDSATSRAGALVRLAREQEAGAVLKERALRSIDAVDELGTRARILIQLAAGLCTEPRLLEEALQLAYRISGANSRSARIQALAGVAASLTGSRQQQTYADAITEADGIRRTTPRMLARAGLIPMLPPGQRLAEAVKQWEDLPTAKDPGVRAGVLEQTAPFLSDPGLAHAASVMTLELKGFPGARSRRTQILTALLPHLADTPHFEGVLAEARNNAREIRNRQSRTEALAQLESYLAGEPKPAGRDTGEETDGTDVAATVATAIGDEDSLIECVAVLSVHPMWRYPCNGEPGQAVVDRVTSSPMLRHTQGFFERTLERLEKGADEPGWVETLYRFSQWLPVDLEPRAVRLMARVANDQSRAELLLRYAPRLSREGVQEALEVARGRWAEPCWRVAALSGLLPRLAEPQRSEVVEQALELALSSPGRKRRLGTVSRLAPHLFQTSQITKSHRDQVIRSTLELANDADVNRQSALEAMAIMVPVLSGGQRRETADQTWEEARDLPHVERFVTTLPKNAQWHCSIIGSDFEDWELQQAAGWDCLVLWKIWVTAKLAPWLSEPSRLQAIEFAHHAVADVVSELIRAEALLQLLSMNLQESRSMDILTDALSTSVRIEDRRTREELFRRLAGHLEELPADSLYPLWHELLDGCAQRNRTELCSDIAALSVALAGLGGADVLGETVDAMEDVERWWP